MADKTIDALATTSFKDYRDMKPEATLLDYYEERVRQMEKQGRCRLVPRDAEYVRSVMVRDVLRKRQGYDPRDREALRPEDIEFRKQMFVEITGEPLSECSCTDCAGVKNNDCTYQFDAYNTNGGCLAIK